MKIIAIDGGNTAVKIAIVSLPDLTIVDLVDIPITSVNSTLRTIIEREGPCPLAVTTSAESLIDILEDATSQLTGCTLHKCTALNTDSLKISYDREKLGSDRVAAALAAHYLYPNSDCIIVDSGTATTVDLVKSSGEFMGGMILPGLGTKIWSLHERTELLPLIDLSDLDISLTPNNTRESIATGVVLDSIGGIKEAVNHLKSSSKEAKLIACGGGWEYIRKFWSNNPFETRKDLTLLGAAIFAESQIKKEAC